MLTLYRGRAAAGGACVCFHGKLYSTRIGMDGCRMPGHPVVTGIQMEYKEATNFIITRIAEK